MNSRNINHSNEGVSIEYRIFAGCPNVAMDLRIDAVLGVFQRGLQDQERIEVRVLNPFFLCNFVLLKKRSRFTVLRFLLLWHFCRPQTLYS